MAVRFDADFTMTIGGESVAGDWTLDVLNPATEAVIATAPDCSSAQLDRAVEAARAAYPKWAATPEAERRSLLGNVADVIEAHVENLARLLTAEQGKPLAAARMEVRVSAYWTREMAKLALPETVNEDSAARLSVTRRVPLGVIAAITPWNYPLGQIAFKLAAPLLAGNTLVLKPSVFTPLTALKLGELLKGVLPVGVLNVISGGDALGPLVTAHPGVDKISFTGSTATGRRVMASASGSLKRLTLELGGNDPAIVLPDVDVAAAAPKLFWAAFSNSGQVCLAAKRIYVHRDVYAPMLAALAALARDVKVGDGMEEGVQLGPVSNRLQYDKVTGLIRDSVEQGHRFAAGGVPERGRGYFVPATIVDDPPESARIVQEEQFGPVVPLLRYDDLDDVVSRANATPYGLGASIWTGDGETALGVARRIQAGTVWINEALHLSPAVAFGGCKQSGVGVENGLEGLLAYTAPQTVTVKRGA